MAFWGVQVKPGRPYIHAAGNNVRGRLHVSQATLGAGAGKDVNGVVFVQCNVGDKSPVYLCALSWEKVISCPVNVEFEEDDDVVFSVVGPRSVHLSGYYFRSSGDPEPPGEDLADSEAEQSVEGSEEDEYEDSFIDDGDPEVFSPSAVSSDEEYTMEDVKVKNQKLTRKRLKKKYQLRDSDDSGVQQTFVKRGARAILSDSDNDDKCPISSLFKAKPIENGIRAYDDKASSQRLSDKTKADLKEDANCVATVDVQDDKDTESLENGTELELKTKQVPKEEKPLASEGKDGPEHNSPRAVHGATVTKKLDPNPGVNEEDQGNPNDKGDNLPEVELPPDDKVYPKKNDKVSADVSLSKKKRKKSENKSQQGEAMAKIEVAHDVLQSGETKKAIGNGILNGNPEHSVEVNSSEKKKKKRRKIQETVDENKESIATKEHSNVDKGPSQIRTLSNGLIIDYVETGKPDSEVAVPGKKVTILYSGKVKEEKGQQLDLSTDGEALKFRLGKERVIKGLDVGIEGMRVGDRRRLIIPPSLGYGSEGNGNNVPPDAWLVYDVKLIKVR